MSNVFICLTESYADKKQIRINANLIVSYEANGNFTKVLSTHDQVYSVLETPEQIDTLLTECYFMIKRI